MSVPRQAFEAEQEQRRRKLVVRSVLDKPSTTREATQQQRQEQEQNVDCPQSDQSTQPQQGNNPSARRLCAGKRKELAMLRRKHPTAFYLGTCAGDWEVLQEDRSLAALQPSPARRWRHPFPWNFKVPARCKSGARSGTASGTGAPEGELQAGRTACSSGANSDAEPLTNGSKGSTQTGISLGPSSNQKSSAPQAKCTEIRQASEVTQSQAGQAPRHCGSGATVATITSADRGSANPLGSYGMRDIHTHPPQPPPARLQQERLKPMQRMLMDLAREMQELDRSMVAHGAGSGHNTTDDPVWMHMWTTLIFDIANMLHDIMRKLESQRPPDDNLAVVVEQLLERAGVLEADARAVAREHHERLWYVSTTAHVLMHVWARAGEGRVTARQLLRVLRMEMLSEEAAMCGSSGEICLDPSPDVDWLVMSMPAQVRKRWQYLMTACEQGDPGAELVATQALCGYIRFLSLGEDKPEDHRCEPLTFAAVNACMLVAQECGMPLVSPEYLHSVLSSWPLPPHPLPNPALGPLAGREVPPDRLSYSYLIHVTKQLAERPAAALAWAHVLRFAWTNRAAWNHLPPPLQRKYKAFHFDLLATEISNGYFPPSPWNTHPAVVQVGEGLLGQRQPPGSQHLAPQEDRGWGDQATEAAGQRQGQRPIPTAARTGSGPRGAELSSQADPYRAPTTDVREEKESLWIHEAANMMQVLVELDSRLFANPRAYAPFSTASASLLSTFLMLMIPATGREGTYSRLAFQADTAAEVGPTGLKLTVFEAPQIPSNNTPGYDWSKIKQALHTVKLGSNVDAVGKALRDALVKKQLRFVWLQAQGMEGVMAAVQVLAKVRRELLARGREFIIRPVCIVRHGDSVPVGGHENDGAVDMPSGGADAGSRKYPAAPSDSGGSKQTGSDSDSGASSSVALTYGLQGALRNMEDQLAAFFPATETQVKNEVYHSLFNGLQALRWLIERQSGMAEEFVMEFVVHECAFGDRWRLEPPEAANVVGTPAALLQQQQREARLQKERLRKALVA